MNEPRAITIALLAMGGEGGGVLADWIVDLAERNGFVAQATSVPGVAQRTGATIYYLELFPREAIPAGEQPVLALAPVPGQVDVVIASELMEAGRALQRGLVTADRTTLVASTHRVYSMTERTALGDGRVDAQALLAGARAAAKRWVAADLARVAEEAGAPIGAALYGALAASGALPFARKRFEETIRGGGVGVEASLRAFAAAFAAVPGPPLRGGDDESSFPARRESTGLGPRLAHLDRRITADFEPALHAVLRHAVLRLADYQDIAYAADYLDRLSPLRMLPTDVLHETARYLALWLSYEDAIRVADLKTRGSRFERVAAEVRLQPAQLLAINEFMHPRPQEIADILPERIGRWLLDSRTGRALVGPFTRKGKVVRTSSLPGFLQLYALAALRPLRRRSLRYRLEHERIADWLAQVQRLAPAHPALALEVARAQRLVKGYGDTHARGWARFQQLMATLPRLEARPDGGDRLRELAQAALADEAGLALERKLASV